MGTSSKKKSNKKTLDLNCTLDQTDLRDIYKTLYPTAAVYTFFSGTHGTFSMIDPMPGHKTSQFGGSLVAQWLRVCLLMQGTWV